VATGGRPSLAALLALGLVAAPQAQLRLRLPGQFLGDADDALG
jgi:hypothetical protein